MAIDTFAVGRSSAGRDSVFDFVDAGPASVERLMGVEGCDALLDVASSCGTTLSSQIADDGRSGSVNAWYEAYVRWFRDAYADGDPVSRYVFTRSMHDLFGLGSRPNGRRAFGASGRRDVQYRVFCYRARKASPRIAREREEAQAAAGELLVIEGGRLAPQSFAHRDFLVYEARKRELEDFFHFSQGKAVSMCEAVAHMFVDRAARFDISRSMRMWDWCAEYRVGGMGWGRRKLPKGRYVLDVTVPATGLPLPPCAGRDLSSESFVRFSFFMRSVDADHPATDSWDEEAAPGAVFGRHCLLSMGITVIEPAIDPVDGERMMREIYIDNPGRLEMSPTGFSFDSDTLLAILGDQTCVKRLIEEMGACEVECVDGEVGHSASSRWLDGEPHSESAMSFDQRASCHRCDMAPYSAYGMAYGRFGNVFTLSSVVTAGYYAARINDAYDEDYAGYVIGDEFSGETGDREVAYDTTKPAAYVTSTLCSSGSHSIPMSDFTH